jgi:putative addiction module component (TIGR02574 family)
VLAEKLRGCDGDASEGPRYRETNCSPALPARRVVNDLLTLPLAQRLELVQTLWGSIAAEQIGPELTESDRQLIDQRLERFLADGDLGLDADEVLDTLEQSL